MPTDLPTPFMRESRDTTFVHMSEGTLVISDKAHACGGCGATHFIFINRGGPTLCAGCDSKEYVHES